MELRTNMPCPVCKLPDSMRRVTLFRNVWKPGYVKGSSKTVTRWRCHVPNCTGDRPDWQYLVEKPFPHNGSLWVNEIAHIRCNATGEIRKYACEGLMFDLDDEAPNTFIWSEGNYACDCNRRDFFTDAGGEERTPKEEDRCGSGRFDVNLENPATGEIFYREYVEIPAPEPVDDDIYNGSGAGTTIADLNASHETTHRD